MSKEIEVKKFSVTAKVPVCATDGSAGYDLFTDEPATLEKGKILRINTNIGLAIPNGYYGQILSRSSIAALGLCVLGGVIDSDYRGSIYIICTNVNDIPIVLPAGVRIAQIVILRTPKHTLRIVDNLSSCDKSDSSDSSNSRDGRHCGFGSTGMF